MRPCADFGHEKNVVPPSLEPTTQYVLGFAIIIFPAVIKKGDTRIQRSVDNLDGFVHILGISEVMSANSQRGNLNASLAESSPGNLVQSGRRSLLDMPWITSLRRIRTGSQCRS